VLVQILTSSVCMQEVIKRSLSDPGVSSRKRLKSTPVRRSARKHLKSTPVERSPRKHLKSTPVRRSPRKHRGSTPVRRSPRKHRSSIPDSPKKNLKERLKEVDRYFRDTDEDKAPDDDNFINLADPSCWKCSKPIRCKSDCFPKGSWGIIDQVLFHCKSCWAENQDELKAQTESESNERQKLKDKIAKKKLEKSTTPKPSKKSATPKPSKKSATPKPSKKSATPKPSKKSATPKPSKKSATPKTTGKLFNVGNNVIAKWTDGKSYPAQVFDTDGDKFSVYFPQDGETLVGIDKGSLSHPKATSVWSRLEREKFLNMDNFDHDEKRKGVPRKFGRYTPVAMGTGKNINKYVCKSSKDGDDKDYLFDMGYVQTKLLMKTNPLTDAGTKFHDKKSLYA